MRVPLRQVKTLKNDNGVLTFLNQSGGVVWKSPNPPFPDSRVIVGEPEPGKPNSFIRIVDSSNKTLWAP